MLISEVMGRWLEWSKSERMETTIKAHYQPFVRIYLEAVGDHEIGEFSIHHIDRLVACLRQKGLNEVTTNMRLQRLSAFLHWARERDYVERFPKIRKMKEPRKLPQILSLEEVGKLFGRLAELKRNALTAFQRRCYLLHERALMVALATGFRRSEVFYLKWDQIDLGRKVITVRHRDSFVTKEKREKQAVMVDYLWLYLDQQKRLFPNEVYLLDDGQGRILYQDPVFLTQAFRRHYRVLGWNNRKVKPLHGFRALFANRLYHELEIELDVVRSMLGHSNERVTRLYLSETDGRHWKAFKKLNEHDQSVLTVKP